METIADRINEILKIKGIKKTEFAKRIGISDSSVSTMCSGKSKPSGQTITMICREFGVNPEWLRDGVGEKFIAAPSAPLDMMARKYRLRLKDYVLIEKLVNLSEVERDALYRFMVDVIAASTACGADPNSYVFEEGTPSPEETAAAEAAYEKSLGIAPSTAASASNTTEDTDCVV